MLHQKYIKIMLHIIIFKLNRIHQRILIESFENDLFSKRLEYIEYN